MPVTDDEHEAASKVTNARVELLRYLGETFNPGGPTITPATPGNLMLYIEKFIDAKINLATDKIRRRE